MSKVQSILIVDDDEHCIELLRLALNAAGAVSILAETESEIAANHIMSNPIDLVVLDIKMPKVNGFDVLKQLRGEGNKTPVIMLSGSSYQQDIDRAYQLGCNSYFEKPGSLDDYRKFATCLVEYWSTGYVPIGA